METKVRALTTQLDEARKLAKFYELKSHRSTTKEQNPMANKKFIQALVTAAAALTNAAAALAEESEGEAQAKPVEAPAPKPVAAPKPAKVATAPAAKVEPAAAVAPAPAAAAPTNGAAGDLMSQTRAAAKAYAEVYGREGLVAVLKQFTPGTLADVPPEKLPEVIKALS